MRFRRTARLLARVLPPKRKPDQRIGRDGHEYLDRWYLIPKNRWFNVMCHVFHRSDIDDANHDHPWWNASFIIRGAYMEWMGAGRGKTVHLRQAGDCTRRRAAVPHRIELFDPRPFNPVTLFITGWKVREWGFWCPKGWRHNREFTNPADETKVGKGCA